MQIARSPIDHLALRAFAALLRRWLGFVVPRMLGMGARGEAPDAETLHRAELRLRKLLLARAVEQLGPRRARAAAHANAPRGFRQAGRDGGAIRQLTRNVLPKPRRRTPQARLARIQHALARLDLYIARLVKRLARNRPATRLIAVAPPAHALTAQTPACVAAIADTS